MRRCWSLRVLLVVALGVSAVQAAVAADKPNILFVFADDQAFDTVAALGNEEIRTPNIDRLVRSGTTYTHAYNQGGYHGAVCVASRTMLNTGRHLWHARRAEGKLRERYVEEQRLWPQLLSRQGYRTYFTGKWHVRAKPEAVFDVVRHVRGGMPRQTPQGYNRPLADQPDPWKPWDRSFGGFWEGGKHWSEVVGDDATAFLEMAADDTSPFFMYIAFNAPHDPRQSPKEYVERYPLEKLGLPQPFYPEYPHQIGSNRIRDEKLAPFPRTEHAVKVHRQEYYAIISHMDAQIGRILDALEASGKGDDTYVFFTADHGLAVGHHGLMGKQNLFDHSVRVPFVAVGERFEAGARRSRPIYLQDVMPTTLELAGAEIPEDVQFESLLVQPDEPWRDAIYGAYTATQRMVTVGDDKLILYPKIGVALLFDLERDPLEERPLELTGENLQRARQLFARLRKLQSRAGDDLDLTAAFPRLAKA